MKKIKRLFIGILSISIILCMTACGSFVKETTERTFSQAPDQAQNDAKLNLEEDTEQQDRSQTVEDFESAGDYESNENTDSFHSDVLVVYFSVTGTTRGVAERIASVTNADIYEILAANPYTENDLKYNDASSRTTLEQANQESRPEIESEDISLEGYKTIYLGYPIWHGQAPRILSTFVEKYSFKGITVIPFCTSGSSEIGQSAVTLKNQAGSGNWLQGKRFDANVSDSEVESWVDGLQ